MESMLTSVIVPVYNGEKYLAAALDSILAQDHRPIEVVVVDDGSTDSSGGVARAFSDVRYIREDRQGPAVARNTGLAECHGEFISFLDADDLWLPDKLSVQAAYLAAHADVGCAMGRMKNFLEEGIHCPRWVDPATISESCACPSLLTLLSHRWVFDKVGRFNSSYRQGEDLEWLIRLTESKIPLARLPELALLRRIHSGNTSHDQNGSARARIRMLKESIDRKRAAGAEEVAGVH